MNRVDDEYYFFIPQLIQNFQAISNNTQINAAQQQVGNVYPGGDGSYGALNLLEKDNTVTKISVYHLETCLGVCKFSTGGWAASINTNSCFSNWHLQVSHITSSINSADTEITAQGTASFYGVFPLGIDDIWYASPTVTIHIYSSGKVSGNINDHILVQTVSGTISEWSDATAFRSNIERCDNIIEYIVT